MEEDKTSISTFKKGIWQTEYFELYCDICGVKHPDVCVNELCEEEGFPDGYYCVNCQKKMIEKRLVKEDKSHYFLKKKFKKYF